MYLESELLTTALQIRRAEELLLEAYKNGKVIGTVHTCLGQELIPVVANKFFSKAFWFSNHRGHGHYLAKTNDFAGLFAEILGKQGGTSRGIGGSQHLLSKTFLSNGVQGGLAGIASGLSSKRNPKNRVSVVFIGDGTLGAGHLYEAWNIAVIEQSRILFVLEDNEVAQSTPSSHTFRGNVAERVSGFGLKYIEASDNSVLELVESFDAAKNSLNHYGPTLLHVKTKRLGPHSKSDDNRDKVKMLELINNDVLTKAIKNSTVSYNSEPVKFVDNIFNEVCLRDYEKKIPQKKLLSPIRKSEIDIDKNQDKIRVSKSINQALIEIAKNTKGIIFIGEDIADDLYNSGADYGGAFKVTRGLSTNFPNQVFSTPISESGITGYGIGLALDGIPAIVEIMFGDFLSQNYDQIFHQLAKIPSMYGRFVPIPIIIRAAVGGGNGYGPTHSATMEFLFLGLPNIVVACINQFTNYLELVKWGLEQQVPLIILEPKRIYNEVYFPDIYPEYELKEAVSGNCRLISPKYNSPNLTIFVYGGLTSLILDSLAFLAENHEIFAEIVIPEILNPVEAGTLRESIRKTHGKLVMIDETINGFGAGSHYLAQLVKLKCEIDLLHIHLNDWHPNGILESNLPISKDEIVTRISNWITNDK